MKGSSKIEWTETTWNPTTGCTKISSGCLNCYAERMSKRLKAMGVEKYENGFNLALHPETLETPYTWKSPKLVFVNSMSDLFHEAMPLDYIKRVFKVMNENPQHTFQVLTKRAKHLVKYHKELEWTPNIWMGVSIEDYTQLERLDLLRQTWAHHKFLSLEPLITHLGPLNLKGINWVIVGGESGPNARPMKQEWVIEIKDSCEYYEVPFFFKQWGGKNKKKTGRHLLGKTFDEIPDHDSMEKAYCAMK